ncbi:MAG TPA: hypothetical protein VEY89_00980, partial [Candidatus Dormibacteraeota bacterium]|nr:hypothetical protein [Candidatus Dormibacteraeota bacterium]
MKIFRRLAAVAGVLSLLGAYANAQAAALASGLEQLTRSYESHNPRLPEQLRSHLTDVTGSPLVLVHLSGADPEAALRGLIAAGFRLTTRSSINRALVEGYLPLAAVRAAAAVPGVKSLHATARPAAHAGLVQSQAVALEHADRAQARGLDGSGIRIGVLSDSYDECTTCSTDAAQDIATGDLPAAGVTVLQDELPSTIAAVGPATDEGRGMLQLVHDIAPGAQLGFASAFNGELSFAENILALRSQFHADVIVDDVGYSDEGMYSDGIVAQAVDIVSRAGAAYFSSAGNNGLEAYEAVYRPVSFADAQALVAAGGANVHLEQIPADIRPQTVHDFRGADGSVAITQRFSSDFAGNLNNVSFQWDEPFFLGLVKTNFIVYVFDKDGNWMDPSGSNFPGLYSTDNNLLTDEPAQLLQIGAFPSDIVGGANVSDFQFVIGNVNGGPAQHIKYVTINGLGVSERQNAPSTFGHPAARGALGVAAVYYAIPSF